MMTYRKRYAEGIKRQHGVRFFLVSRASLLLCVLILGWINSGEADDTSATNAPLGVARVVQSRLVVPIPKTPHVFNVGSRLQLFQENEQFYVVVVKEGNEKRLVATPRRKGMEKVGWVTPENFLLFAYRTESVDGVFYLTAGEELPVVREEASHYLVQVKRGTEQVVLPLPRAEPSLYFIPNPVTEKPAPAEHPMLAQDSASRRPGRKIPLKPAQTVEPKSRPAAWPLSETEKLMALLDTNWESSVLSFLLPDEWAEHTPVKSFPASTWWQRFEFTATDETIGGTLELIKQYAQYIAIGLLALILILSLALTAWRRARLTKQAPAQQEPPPPAQNTLEPPVLLTAPSPPDFSGSLASMSLAAVVQFLHSDKETGKLTLYTEDHTPMGMAMFLDGEIVDAEIGNQTGVPAVYEMMGQQEGHFSFVRSRDRNIPRVIQQPTMSILLEANRLLDEKKEKQPPEAVAKSSKRKDSLRLRRHAAH